MHHISKITIKNYKSIIDADFPLSIYTPLVGYNNAGKTNIMNAISWLIKTSSLLEADYNDPTQPVVVTAEISGITNAVLTAIGETHREKIRPLVIDEKLYIRRTQNLLDTSTNDKKLKILIKTDNSEEWGNPAGIDNAIAHLFPEPIFIGAMENAAEDVVKNSTGTTIGKLIKEIIEPIASAHSQGVKRALARIGEKLSADSPQRDNRLRVADAEIQDQLRSLFPGVSAKIHIPVSEFSDFLKGATIKIFDDEYNRPNGQDPSSFGHGTQRMVQIALIKYLAKIKKNNAQTERTTLILIDEPELYLHPQAIELVRSSLSTLAKEGYQVIFATHSANMIAKEDVANALLIRRNSTVGTVALRRIQDAVAEEIGNAPAQAEVLFELTNAVKILFSEKIVLAEGKTEKTILPEIYKHKFKNTLDADKMGLVALGGVNNTPNALKVLQAMGIIVRAVVDLDFAFTQEGLFVEGNPDIVACKLILENLRDDNRIGLDEAGLPRQRGNVSAANAFELMAQDPVAQTSIQNLHQDLREQGIWLWKYGAIEPHLGITGKTTRQYQNFISNLHPNDFMEGETNYQEVTAMLNWLRS